MSLRQKYLEILAEMVSAGAIGVSLLLGSTAPAAADRGPASAQPRAADRARVSEQLAAIREAVSDVAGPSAGQSGRRLAWWAWRNGGGGWGLARRGLAQWRLAQWRLAQFLAQLVNGPLSKAQFDGGGRLLV